MEEKLTGCHHGAGPQRVLDAQALVDGRVAVLLRKKIVGISKQDMFYTS